MRRNRDDEHLTPRQFANGWISADTDDGRGVIVSPRDVVLDDEDVALFKNTPAHHVGFFWQAWELQDDGSFRSLRTGARGRRHR